MWFKLFGYATGFSKLYSFNHIPNYIVFNHIKSNVKLVKHTGLLCFGHSLDQFMRTQHLSTIRHSLFLPFSEEPHFTRHASIFC